MTEPLKKRSVKAAIDEVAASGGAELSSEQLAQIAGTVAAMLEKNRPEPEKTAAMPFNIKDVQDFLATKRKRGIEQYIDPSHRPESLDLKKLCEEKAASLGHKITTWLTANYTEKWMVRFKYDWYAYCDNCGAWAYARWTGPDRLCPDKSREDVKWHHSCGGPCLAVRESAFVAAKHKRTIPSAYKRANAD